MLEKNVNNRLLVEIVSLEDLVPEDHLLRKIDAAVDFSKIYEFVEDLYCEDNGRPSIDGTDPTSLWNYFAQASSKRSEYECSIPLVFRIQSA